MASVRPNSAVRSIRGKSGDTNYAETPNGIEWKNNPIHTKPPTAAQIAQRARLKAAGAAFRLLTPAQNAQWQAYALTYTVKSKTDKAIHPSAYNAFAGLATKFLAVNPTGTIPATSPVSSFGGDTIVVTASGGAGLITFTASAKNGTNVTTELLIQKLANINRKPTSAYPSRGFFAFPIGTLIKTVALVPGTYAAAYRFVNSATGQEVALVTLGVFTVS